MTGASAQLVIQQNRLILQAIGSWLGKADPQDG